MRKSTFSGEDFWRILVANSKRSTVTVTITSLLGCSAAHGKYHITILACILYCLNCPEASIAKRNARLSRTEYVYRTHVHSFRRSSYSYVPITSLNAPNRSPTWPIWLGAIPNHDVRVRVNPEWVLTRWWIFCPVPRSETLAFRCAIVKPDFSARKPSIWGMIKTGPQHGGRWAGPISQD